MGTVGQPYVTRGAVSVCYCHRRLMVARLENSGALIIWQRYDCTPGRGRGRGGGAARVRRPAKRMHKSFAFVLLTVRERVKKRR